MTTTDLVLLDDWHRWQPFQNPYLRFLQRHVGIDRMMSDDPSKPVPEYEGIAMPDRDLGRFFRRGFASYGQMWNLINGERQIDRNLRPRPWRHWLTSKYAWAIPNEHAIRRIAAYGPVVEIGAGTGYWAWLLSQVGCDVLAYDHYPPDGFAPWHEIEHAEHAYERWNRGIYDPNENRPWHSSQESVYPVKYGTPGSLKRVSPKRTLFLCWPTMSSQAADCVRHFRGNTIAYVGEGEGGCTADDEFFEMLEKEWDEIEDIPIPQWDLVHDSLSIYRRKQ